jgi:hypothetical protein
MKTRGDHILTAYSSFSRVGMLCEHHTHSMKGHASLMMNRKEVASERLLPLA